MSKIKFHSPIPLWLRRIGVNKRSAFVFLIYLLCCCLWSISVYLYYTSAPTVAGYHGEPIQANAFVLTARISAGLIYINLALLFVPKLLFLFSRRTIYSLLGYLIPSEQMPRIHNFLAWMVVLMSSIHTIAYLSLYAYWDKTWAESFSFHYRMTGHMAEISGIILVILLFFIAVPALLRHKIKYEWFYFTHWLFVPFVIITAWHAPQTLIFVGTPATMYVLDRWIRYTLMRKSSKLLMVEKDHKDVMFEVERPHNFFYRPGDYAYINIPAISRYEWHAFSAVSTPDNRRVLAFKVRHVGEWTAQLKNIPVDSLVKIDGPFFSPSSGITESRNNIIIASGIGITPYLSYVIYLLQRAHEAEGLKGNLPDRASSNIKSPILENLVYDAKSFSFPKKVFLYWLEPNASSFEKFIPIILELKELLPHIFDFQLIAGRETADSLFTTNPYIRKRRIDWVEELNHYRQFNLSGDLSVYYCGNPILSEHIETICRTCHFSFKTECF